MFIALLLCTTILQAQTPDSVLRDRRQRAAHTFSDGVLLLRARSDLDLAADGFRQDPFFFYYTDSANTAGDILAIDGKTGESRLFRARADSAKLRAFLAEHSGPLYYAVGNAEKQLDSLMAVQTVAEQAALRSAASATVLALKAGLRAIRPGVRQRRVELAVVDACWNAGAHGVSFWPWAMAGSNAVFPRPFASLERYDHLDTTMRAGDLVRLDVGCEWDHYIGDLGRTVPVSGHYDDAQRETWTIFVAAYHAGARLLKAGVTTDQVFDAWRNELRRHRASARSPLAQHAIDAWSSREHVPFWQIHTTNLRAGHPPTSLPAGTVINFEPITAVDGQAFFLEDMYLITPSGAELLTPGVPYSADDIEHAMTETHGS